MMLKDIDPRMPRFRTEGPRHKARVFLQCSSCEADIRELQPKESINVTRAYYCFRCDNGTVIQNPPVDSGEEA